MKEKKRKKIEGIGRKQCGMKEKIKRKKRQEESRDERRMKEKIKKRTDWKKVVWN